MKAPRVTEILRYFTHYDQVPKKILENAAARGSSVHAICAGIAKGAWVPDGMIGEELLGYVSSFRKWQEATVKQFLIIEKRYEDTDVDFSGQVDFIIVTLNDELYLVDLKTSAKPQKTYPVQMAAYNHLLKKHNVTVKGAMLVYLDRAGEFPKVHTIDDMSKETHVFMCALDCWHYFNKRKV